MNNVEQVYYINLEHRVDRDTMFLEWLEESKFPDSKITRIDAVHTPGKGFLGAALSHIKALEAFINSDYNVCCIYEDDYQPINSKSYWSEIQKVFEQNIDFDMVLLSYNVLKSEPTEHNFLHRVEYSLTASGYLITKKFAHSLLENMKEGYEKNKEYTEKEGVKNSDYCLDTYWIKLFSTYKVYCIYPRLGKQMSSYSDIENQYISYNA